MEYEPHYVIHDMREAMANRESVSHLPTVEFEYQIPVEPSQVTED